MLHISRRSAGTDARRGERERNEMSDILPRRLHADRALDTLYSRFTCVSVAAIPIALIVIINFDRLQFRCSIGQLSDGPFGEMQT